VLPLFDFGKYLVKNAIVAGMETAIMLSDISRLLQMEYANVIAPFEEFYVNFGKNRAILRLLGRAKTYCRHGCTAKWLKHKFEKLMLYRRFYDVP